MNKDKLTIVSIKENQRYNDFLAKVTTAYYKDKELPVISLMLETDIVNSKEKCFIVFTIPIYNKSMLSSYKKEMREMLDSINFFPSSAENE